MMGHAISSFMSGLSETKRAVAAIGGAVAFGIVVGGFASGIIYETPDRSLRNEAAIDSIRPIVYQSERAIAALEIVDDERDDQMARIEAAIEQIRLNQCLTLAELRGDLTTDRCRRDE